MSEGNTIFRKIEPIFLFTGRKITRLINLKIKKNRISENVEGKLSYHNNDREKELKPITITISQYAYLLIVKKRNSLSVYNDLISDLIN